MKMNEQEIEEFKKKFDSNMLKFGIIGSAGAIGAILGIIAYNQNWLPF